MMCVMLRRRNRGRLKFLLIGSRSRMVDDMDWSLRSNSLANRMEKAINVSLTDLRSLASSSVTKAERKLNEGMDESLQTVENF